MVGQVMLVYVICKQRGALEARRVRRRPRRFDGGAFGELLALPKMRRRVGAERAVRVRSAKQVSEVCARLGVDLILREARAELPGLRLVGLSAPREPAVLFDDLGEQAA